MGDELITRGLIQIQLDQKGIDAAVDLLKKITDASGAAATKVEGVGKAAHGAGKEVGYLEEQFASLQRRLVAGVGFLELAAFAKESFLEFAKLDRGLTTLRSEIDAIGGSAHASLPEVREFLEALGEETGTLESALVPAMNRLLLTTDNTRASQELLAAAVTFADAGFGDLQSNTDRLAVALQTGNVKSLRPFGIQLKDAQGKAIDLSEAFKRIFERAEQLRNQAPDAQSKVEAWGRIFEQIKVSAGGAANALLDFLKKRSDLEEKAIKEDRARFLGISVEELEARENKRLQVIKDTNEAVRKFNEDAIQGPKTAPEKSAQELANEEAARLKLEANKALAEQIRDLDEKSAQDRLKAEIDVAEQGSARRLELELKLNDRVEAAAIATARAIGAKTEDIRRTFEIERSKIIAGKGETAETRNAREDAAGFDPRAGFDKVEKFFDEHLAKMEEANKRFVKKMDEDWAESIKRQMQLDEDRLHSNIRASQQMAIALGVLFSKNKSFAIGMAIINTALGITDVWTDKTLSFYEKVAATVVVAASGLEQLQAIKGASASGGGSVGVGGAAAPPFAQSGAPSQAPAFTPGNFQGVSAASSAAGAMSGGGSSGSSVVFNIDKAFGDRRSMTMLTNEIVRVLRNNQSVLR